MDAVEAFRAAYADQLMTPEDQDIDSYTGLPTSEISNTSPWIEHTGLWRYPSGKGPDEDLKQPFIPSEHYEEELDDDDDDSLTDSEVDTLLEELLSQSDADQLEALIDELVAEGDND